MHVVIKIQTLTFVISVRCEVEFDIKMEDLNFLLHCAPKMDHNFYNLTVTVENILNNSNNAINISNDSEINHSDLVMSELREELAHFSAIAGLFLMFFIDVLLKNPPYKRASPAVTRTLTKIFRQTFSRTSVLTVLFLVSPIVSIVLFLAVIYKFICLMIIKIKDKHFVSLLESFDVFWSLENDATTSIINVLCVIESYSPFTLLNNIKEKLTSIITNDDIQKIFYRRHEEYGFFYWRRNSPIDIEQYVQIVDSENMDEKGLENLMSEVQNQSLPYNDEGLFKILITRERIGKCEEERGEYGIIFKIHHSVGDGVALIDFLCQTLADPAEEVLKNKFVIPENGNSNRKNISDMIKIFFQIPLCFVDGILRKPDDNTLHGPPLTGKKLFKWTQFDKDLLDKVKTIKGNADLNFTDVLLKSLSRGLQKYFEQKQSKAGVPENIAAILPVRFPKKNADFTQKFKNDFTVTTLDVPLRNSNIEEIKMRCNHMRISADPLTNYYFLKLVTSTLPSWILYPLLQSVQATLVFSNMPGPDTISICGGNDLKSMVFFVPNKGTTGMGITSLCYGGSLRFAAMADAAVVSSSDDLAIILDGMVEEITRLHQELK